MTTYYKQNNENEQALIEDFKLLLERTIEEHQFTYINPEDVKEQKEWLEHEILSASRRKKKEYVKQLEKLKQFEEKYTHAWTLQIKRNSGLKFANKALTINYKAGRNDIAEVDVGETKYMANLGKAGLGGILLFAGPIGWIIGGSLGLSGLGGLVTQSDMNSQITKLFEKHLEKEEVQSFS